MKMTAFTFQVFVVVILTCFHVQIARGACGGWIEGVSGVIRSPGFPNNYPHSTYCVWNIKGLDHSRITLTPTSFNLEREDNCGYDSLVIRDGHSEISPLVGKYCGNQIKSSITSNSNILRLEFKSDGGTSSSGFEIQYDSTTKVLECNPHQFRCHSGKCISRHHVCDGNPRNCFASSSDEHGESSDELNCDVTKVGDFISEKRQCVQWFMERRSNSSVYKWGLQVHRTAVALYFADKNFFAQDNKTGEEIRYELVIHLLTILNRREILRTEQLALYVHAMLVSCLNPRDFYNHDLVSDLRKRVDMSNYTNPLAILVLCNAGATMTTDDLLRLQRIFSSQSRPFWTEIQAIATMALSCIATKTPVSVHQDILRQWVDTAIMHQFLNGSVSNPRTTALTIQMLLGTGYSDGFNWQAAVGVVRDATFSSSSNFLDKYYLMPVLSNRSSNTIDSSHCNGLYYNVDLFKKSRERRSVVHYSVWKDKESDFGRTWRLRMPTSSSLYDVIEKVKNLDSTHTVLYNIVDGKPYIRSVSDVDEDPETDHFWFTYERTLGSNEDPTLLEDSPVDINTRDNQEFILWYRKGMWNPDPNGYGSGELL